MTREQAIAIIEHDRGRYGVPADAELCRVEERWIELCEGDPERPTRVRDARVWLLCYEVPPGPEIAIDQRTGEVVRVETFY